MRFLHTHGLLIPDDTAPTDVDEQAILDRIHALPETTANEMRQWVRVLRGEGRRQHQRMPFGTIRGYLGYLHPIVEEWAHRVVSLREISAQDIHTALAGVNGRQARSTHTALGSLFRALKQQHLIFRDPTRGISLPANHRLPVPLSPDRLRGLLDQAHEPVAKLMIALVAIHALRPADLRSAQAPDLDLSRGRLTVSRGTQHHIAYLDELTTELAIAWLAERNHRWPSTTNPHLFISQQTASDPQNRPTTRGFTDLHFRRLGISATQLRMDRFLDEARHTADPVHLMRLFSIGEGTAMHYLHAAHPERQTVIPR